MTEPAGPAGIRIGTAERDAAIQALGEHMSAGRLDADEYGDRVAAASAARYRSDLEPLFADLPGGAGALSPASSPASPPAPSPAPAGAPSGPPAYVDATGRTPLGGRVGTTVVALSPFLALALFFVIGALGGWSFAWIVFLLVPIAGTVVYGGAGRQRDRRR